MLHDELVPLFQEGLTEEEKATLTPKFLAQMEAETKRGEAVINASSKSVDEDVALIRHNIMENWIMPGPDIRRSRLIPDPVYQKIDQISQEALAPAIDRLVHGRLIVLSSDDLEQKKQDLDALVEQVQPFNQRFALYLKEETISELLYASGRSDKKDDMLKVAEQRMDYKLQRLGMDMLPSDEQSDTFAADSRGVPIEIEETVPMPHSQVVGVLTWASSGVRGCRVVTQDAVITVIWSYWTTWLIIGLIAAGVFLIIFFSILATVVGAVTWLVAAFFGLSLAVPIPLRRRITTARLTNTSARHTFKKDELLTIKVILDTPGSTEVRISGTTHPAIAQHIRTAMDNMRGAVTTDV